MDNFINTLFDESIIEYILTKSLIFDGMDENDKQIIEFFINSDKEIHFANIKSAFILRFLIEFGYVIDKVENKYILKITSSSFIIFIRPYLNEQAKKYEKEGIINIGKNIFKKFNKKVENTILKDIDTNNNDEINVMKSIYLESYNNILITYEDYIRTTNKLSMVISYYIIYLFIYPLLYKLKYGLVRNIFNSIFSIVYNMSVIKLFDKKRRVNNNKNKSENEHSTKQLINMIISLFDNVNVIVENNALTDELKNIMKQFESVINDSDFIKQYMTSIYTNNYISAMKKYKLTETIVSIIINDQNMLLFLEVNKSNIISYIDTKLDLYKKLKTTHVISDIINNKPYKVAETIQWDNNENIKYIFTLHDIVLNYKNSEGGFDTIIDKININFEIGKTHFFYGNSGCGKTTLLNVLMKKIHINSGSVKFLDIYDGYSYFSIRKYLTYMSCENAVFYNHLYFNFVYGIAKEKLLENKKEIKHEIIKYMTMFGLNKFIPVMKTKNALNLSKGQKQRVVIIRLMMHIIFNNLRILFLDEFTSNIDNKMEETIYTELIKLQKIYNFTVFFVSHNLYNIKYSDYNYQFNTEEHSITKKRTTTTDKELEL
jgi:ABC-type multidrug transport system ATPase subunit